MCLNKGGYNGRYDIYRTEQLLIEHVLKE